MQLQSNFNTQLHFYHKLYKIIFYKINQLIKYKKKLKAKILKTIFLIPPSTPVKIISSYTSWSDPDSLEVKILKSKMSKLKFLTKWNEENEYIKNKKPYSPKNEINDMEIEEHVPNDEPSSPVSITFDVERLPFQDDDINEENFLQELHHLFHLMHKVNIITILFAKIFFQLRNIQSSIKS